ncbi:MAG: SDR family oxidoreductase [Chloroflexota bacterium]|nr:SDR family oxidoreductase [Chloroflexota bacterium]
MELKDKVSVITGGTSGIGKATVLRFVEEGAKVAFCGRRDDMGMALQKEIEEAGYPGEAVYFHCDVSIEKEVKAFAAAVKEEFGNCEVLFNNAGVHLAGKLHETKPDAWDRIMNVDLRGAYLVCYYFIPQMLEKKYGTIINMSSVSGLLGDTDMVAYNTAKGAITNMTRCMALDYATDGIRVNAVCPGITRSEIVSHTFESVDGAEQKFRDAYPVHYIAEAVEVANAVVFLASRKCDFITGVNLPIDGGITAHTGQPYMGKY